jgi:hypothetical protein
VKEGRSSVIRLDWAPAGTTAQHTNAAQTVRPKPWYIYSSSGAPIWHQPLIIALDIGHLERISQYG